MKPKRGRKPVLLRGLFPFWIATDAELAALVASSGGVCGVCGKPEADGPRRGLAVDHCHDTGKLRGLLCTRCNSALGLFHDDPELLQKAISYLSRIAGTR